MTLPYSRMQSAIFLLCEVETHNLDGGEDVLIRMIMSSPNSANDVDKVDLANELLSDQNIITPQIARPAQICANH